MHTAWHTYAHIYQCLLYILYVYTNIEIPELAFHMVWIQVWGFFLPVPAAKSMWRKRKTWRIHNTNTHTNIVHMITKRNCQSIFSIHRLTLRKIYPQPTSPHFTFPWPTPHHCCTRNSHNILLKERVLAASIILLALAPVLMLYSMDVFRTRVYSLAITAGSSSKKAPKEQQQQSNYTTNTNFWPLRKLRTHIHTYEGKITEKKTTWHFAIQTGALCVKHGY